MRVSNTYSKCFQFISILLIVLLITPIAVSSIIDEELYNYSIYENSQNEEKNHENDTEEKEEKELEDFVFSNNLNEQGLCLLNNKLYSFDFIFLSNNKVEILTPPPENMVL